MLSTSILGASDVVAALQNYNALRHLTAGGQREQREAVLDVLLLTNLHSRLGELNTLFSTKAPFIRRYFMPLLFSSLLFSLSALLLPSLIDMKYKPSCSLVSWPWVI
jgi:hypothetical protein